MKLDIESRLNKQGTGSLVLRRASSCNHIMKPPQESVADQSQVEHMCVIWQHVKPIKASTGFLLKLSISRSFGSLILKHRMLRLAQSPVITWKMLLVSKRLCATINYAFSPSCGNTFSFQVFDSCGFTSFQIPPKKAHTFLGVIFHGFRVCPFFCTK